MSIEKLMPWLIPIVLFILAQTGAFLWWASSITTSMGFIRKQLEEMQQTLGRRGTEKDHDAEVLHKRVDELEKRIRDQEQFCAGCPGRQKKS